MLCTPPEPFADARQAYQDGMGLRRLRLRFHLSETELRDVAPEEFAETVQPEGNIGGY